MVHPVKIAQFRIWPVNDAVALQSQRQSRIQKTWNLQGFGTLKGK